MGKAGGGGVIIGYFSSSLTSSGSVGTETWIDLGLIPVGYRYWIGTVQWTAIDKTTGFELRTNSATKSTGTTATTTIISTASCTTGKSLMQDLYKSGTLHTTTIKSTGVEHWWVRIYAKSSTLGSYLYKLSYTVE